MVGVFFLFRSSLINNTVRIAKSEFVDSMVVVESDRIGFRLFSV